MIRKFKLQVKKKEELEPEEILLDAKQKEMEERARLELPIKTSVFFVLACFLIFLFLLLYGKTVYLTIAQGEKLSEMARKNYLRVKFIEAPRGIIYSSEGEVLAKNKKEKKDDKEVFVRVYPEGKFFAHILGYINEVLKEEIKKDPYYQLGDRIGREGIEKEYEKYLRGEKGKIEKVVNAKGEVLEEKLVKKPKIGDTIYLNIQAKLQKKIFEVLEKRVKDKKASVVVLNPQNGKVLALVSYPSYDNNLISKKYKEYLSDPSSPLLNRPLAGRYPSGSTIKPLIAVAGLEEKIIDEKEKIYCPGFIRIENPWNPALPTIKKDWKRHGIVDLKKALAESCNVYFFTVGGGYKNIKGLGIKRIKKYLDLFFVEEKVGIDLPGEKVGFVPTPEWFEKERKAIERRNWSIADVYDVSIGQGFFSITPLHLAVAHMAIANGGKIFRPQIVKKIVSPEGKIIKNFKPVVLRENIAKKENIEKVREGMRYCVTSPSGSCRRLQDLPVTSAGKTGTAEAGFGKEPHAWFVAFAPYENPEILIVVLVENGGGGSKVALPIAKEVLKWYFSQKR